MLRKQGLKLLEKENIPGARSKAPPHNPGNLHFLRHVRFRHNTRLSCCICHCISLLKYLVQSKGLSVTYHSSRNALGLGFFIALLFERLYCKPGIYGSSHCHCAPTFAYQLQALFPDRHENTCQCYVLSSAEHVSEKSMKRHNTEKAMDSK